MSKVDTTFTDINIAKQFIDQMGQLECIEFDNLQKNTSNLRKPYSRDLLQIKEILNQINTIQQIINKYKSTFIYQNTETKYDEHKESNQLDLQYNDILNTYQMLQKFQTDEENIQKQITYQNNITKSLSTDINLFINKIHTK
eukprot:416801_1